VSGAGGAPCDRFAREGLAELEAGGLEAELTAHVEGCAQCQAERARYRRLIGALAEVSAGARRRGDHVARALARADAEAIPIGRSTERSSDRAVERSRGRANARRPALLAAPLVAMAAALALVWWLRRDPAPGPEPLPEPPRFAFELVEQPGRAMRGAAQLGQRLRVRARAGAALWVVRNDVELLLVCPRDCRRDGAQLVGEVALDAIGHYQMVWLSTDQVPAPGGELARDLAAVRAAGATYELRDVEVQ
jgi:hypothetical protein